MKAAPARTRITVPAGSAVHVVLPVGVDDPARPSGGNVYDRRMCDGLSALGWCVGELKVKGGWPDPDPAALRALFDVLAQIPDGAPVLLDGLIASAAGDVLLSQARRLRLVVLVHLPLGMSVLPAGATGFVGVADDVVAARERAVLTAAAAVLTTSNWTRRWLIDRYALPPELVHVAEPGVDPAERAQGTDPGGRLLCVATVAPHKGHDVLLAALGTVVDLHWECMCVGNIDSDPGFVHLLDRQARAAGIAGRVRFAGALTGAELSAAYRRADVLVSASHTETYGMVVTEALARGLPAIATAAGGLPEALGVTGDGTRPGILVPVGDSGALAAALRRWLLDDDLRRRLRQAAGERRATLTGWSVTASRIAAVLAGVTA